ncbi:hypothetical protein TSMEX_002508 [Taenia solium]|eukprot:TsM_000549000 transcript=TsM_000549000 gene=TsM_000549000
MLFAVVVERCIGEALFVGADGENELELYLSDEFTTDQLIVMVFPPVDEPFVGELEVTMKEM